MTYKRTVVRALARAFVAERMDRVCVSRKTPKWISALITELEETFPQNTRPSFAEIQDSILTTPAFDRAWEGGIVEKTKLDLAFPIESASMRPVKDWPIPSITDLAELAPFLRIHPDEFSWLTSYSRKTSHYLYQWHQKPGRSQKRLIEIPKPILKLAQKNILHSILEFIPVHESACGFRKETSVFDFVRPHHRRAMVLKIDLQDFFPSIRATRVTKLFLSAGYPEVVAIALTKLCTNAVRQFPDYRIPHLPQGAPSSPALANLCAFRLDCRLSGLAYSAGAKYTRYADDLLFSGDESFARGVQRFHIAALSIILEEGFTPNYRKTRFMPSSQRQHAAGLVLNEKPNVSRAEFDQLKAILTNCARSGWRSQNLDNHSEFRSHLQGRVAWVIASNPTRGARLHKLFEAIDWS